MLGGFNGLPYPDSVYNGLYNLSHVDTMVAWWDFTDIDQLYQTRLNYNTAVSSDGDLIGRCKNKANPSTATHKVGNFIRADVDGDRPTYKTGGAGGHSYALFDGSNTGLICRSDSTDYGAYSTDVLSTTLIINTQLDIWIIGEPVDNDSDGTNEVALSYFGYRGTDSSYADEEQETLFTFEREDDEDLKASWLMASSGTVGNPPVTPNLVTATQSFSHWNSGETTIINISGRSGVGASHIYTNNTPDIGQTLYDTSSVHAEAVRQEGIITLDNSSWDNTKVSSFGIGGQVGDSGAISSSQLFEGKIYEIVVYSLNVPNTTERNAIASYFMTKYGVT